MTNLELIKEKLNNTEIILCDIRKEMCDAWTYYFDRHPNVKVYNCSFADCMNTIQNHVAIATPANSYGLMDGGYDKAVINYFGSDLQKSVQEIIRDMYCGEQPVGTAFAVTIPNYDNATLIHIPTMRKPEPIRDHTIVYHCTRSAIICGLKSGYNKIILPAFGGVTGGIPENELAYYMERAYTQLINVPSDIPTWHYARFDHPLSALSEITRSLYSQ